MANNTDYVVRHLRDITEAARTGRYFVERRGEWIDFQFARDPAQHERLLRAWSDYYQTRPQSAEDVCHDCDLGLNDCLSSVVHAIAYDEVAERHDWLLLQKFLARNFHRHSDGEKFVIAGSRDGRLLWAVELASGARSAGE